MTHYRVPLIALAIIVAGGIAAYAISAPKDGAANAKIPDARITDTLPQTTLQPAEPDGKAPKSMEEVNLTFAPVVRQVIPAVVNVYSRSVVRQQVNPFFNDPFFGHFFGAPQQQKRVQQSLGSGVIIRSDGLIITNNHVVSGGQDIVVALSDKREFKAKVILADKRTDLAVLKIDAHEKLPTVKFANSDHLQVGDLVLAVGDPFGVGQTVTMGIVSALARTEVSASNYQFFIQTDAAINPGNSGGALVNTRGQLVGINTAIYSRSGGNIGIGFAIPANLVRRVAEGALHGGVVQLPWLGVDGQAVNGDLASSLGLPRPEGVLLKSVYGDSPAGHAGLKVGDVVLSVDGVAVDDMQSLNYRIATHNPGDEAGLQVVRDGKTISVSAKLAVPPEKPARDKLKIGGRTPLTGATVENLSPAVASDLEMDLSAKGVVVADIENPSFAARYGFRKGDIVLTVNGQSIENTRQLKSLAEGAHDWYVVVSRGGRKLTLRVRG